MHRKDREAKVRRSFTAINLTGMRGRLFWRSFQRKVTKVETGMRAITLAVANQIIEWNFRLAEKRDPARRDGLDADGRMARSTCGPAQRLGTQRLGTQRLG
jgi:hypothetical protein